MTGHCRRTQHTSHERKNEKNKYSTGLMAGFVSGTGTTAIYAYVAISVVICSCIHEHGMTCMV